MPIFGDKQLRQAKRKAKKEQRKKFKLGQTTRKEFKAAKKEIRKYTDY